MSSTLRPDNSRAAAASRIERQAPDDALPSDLPRILSAHKKGKRTLTHEQIKQAVEEVFERRYGSTS